MRFVRPFLESDIQQVAQLHHRGFKIPRPLDDKLLRAYDIYFRERLLYSTPANTQLPCLVFEDSGRIDGFLAVHSICMRFRGKPILAAVGSQFVVDRSSRGLPGIQLIKTFMNGPQDLSLGDESNDDSRKLWEALGGSTAFPFSGKWFLPLRPTAYGLRSVANGLGGAGKAIATVFRPLAGIADRMLVSIPRSPFRFARPVFSELALSPQDLVACAEFSTASILPSYEVDLVERSMKNFAKLTNLGELTAVLLRASATEIAGCFIYFKQPAGLSEVLYIASQTKHTDQVVDQMFDHAYRNGAQALAGRLSPAYFRSFSKASCVLSRRPNWMLVHARDPELTSSLCGGDASFSTLDGELNLHFNHLDAMGSAVSSSQ